MQKCLDIKRSHFWSVFLFFPDTHTLVNNSSDLWNIVISYCVISRKSCYNTQVRNSFWRLMEFFSWNQEYCWKFEKVGKNIHVPPAGCFAVESMMDDCFWSGSLTLLQSICLCCWFIFITCMRHWLDSRHSLCLLILRVYKVPAENIYDGCPPAVYPKEKTVWHLGHARRFPATCLEQSSGCFVEPEQCVALGLRPRVWTFLGKGVENLKKQKNEMLETDMDFFCCCFLFNTWISCLQ